VTKVLIIAEAGVNHNGSMELAKKLIDSAAEAGADYVKFQTFKAAALVSKKAEKAAYQKENMKDDVGNSQYEMLKKLELSEDQHDELISYCKEKNIRFLSTAFDEESIDLLSSKGIDLFKVPSGEITNLPYLKKIAAQQRPVIISTGMSTMDEIKDTLNVFLQEGISKNDITILHCNTEYPTPFTDVNLKAMSTIAHTFKVPVGYSDHTVGIEVPVAAVALGAAVIEKHFTLDRNMEGPDHKASLEPGELKAMVSAIRNIEQALGTDIKQPSASEQKNIAIARKSIHLKTALPAGHLLQASDFVMKRPGDGISPMRMDEFIGKKLLRDLPEEHKLSLTDLA
jgi:N,N'-diacetyllegionaminate synthase